MVTSLFPLQSGLKFYGYIVFSVPNFAKWNGYIVPHVLKPLVIPVSSFQADY
jgi:hypothetical protein